MELTGVQWCLSIMEVARDCICFTFGKKKFGTEVWSAPDMTPCLKQLQVLLGLDEGDSQRRACGGRVFMKW